MDGIRPRFRGVWTVPQGCTGQAPGSNRPAGQPGSGCTVSVRLSSYLYYQQLTGCRWVQFVRNLVENPGFGLDLPRLALDLHRLGQLRLAVLQLLDLVRQLCRGHFVRFLSAGGVLAAQRAV